MIPGIFSVIACFIKGKCVPLSPNYKDLRQCTIKVHQSKYNMTMKKEIYLKPSMQVLEVEPIQIVMTSGFKASRKAYGDAIEQTWEVDYHHFLSGHECDLCSPEHKCFPNHL